VTEVSIKDKIRKAGDLDKETVDIPEWDVTVEVRSMSARQRALMANYTDLDDQSNSDRQEALWAFLLTSCVFDPQTGEAVFDEDDLDWLFTEKSFAVIDRLTTKCLSVSSVLKDSADAAGKSSSATPTETE
jgi:hypothetical protein